MKKTTSVAALRGAAMKISDNRGEHTVSGAGALAKLFIQPKRDWAREGAPRTGWKRGELFEVATAETQQQREEELGDCAYYVAQSGCWPALLMLPVRILDAAVKKFTRRAFKQ